MPETRVVSRDDGHAGECECGFTSSQWPTLDMATNRIAQHANEHDTGELMPSLHVFRDEHGWDGGTYGDAQAPEPTTSG